MRRLIADGDDVARGEVLLRVHAGHDPLAGGVEQDRALAAHRLADRAPAGRSASGPRHSTVGWNCTNSMSRAGQPGAQRERQAVAGDRRRVRRGGEDLAVAAGGEHDGAGGDDADRHDGAVLVDARDAHARGLALARRVACRRAGRARTRGPSPRRRRRSRSRRACAAPRRRCGRRRSGRCGCGCGRPRGSAPDRRRRATGRTRRRAASGSGAPSAPRRRASRTAASSHSPAPAASVSRTWFSSESVRVEHAGQATLGPRRASRRRACPW